MQSLKRYHPFTSSFREETLRSEVVVQFLDANFICWGALANRGDGLQMATTLGATNFPFCAVIAPAPGESLTVLQQIAFLLTLRLNKLVPNALKRETTCFLKISDISGCPICSPSNGITKKT
ncbi:plant UBX domain-containing protein 10-like isoform X2 [Cucurbita moschata]|uniref:Plant UBX domain-containing protein 10-like isoform X2 n=1 Tax=Cucurbita moschata TaxID=3662 RepID=A0A6J1HKR4_CUCMO|nr:plant UBX domain-containing protein 10-like isoform X2 [Cucurbita moschata]